MKDKEIKPLYGIGPVKFGLSREAVEKILGDPSDSHIEEYEDDIEAQIIGYSELGIELTFSSDDSYLLGMIRFFDSEFRLGSDKLIGEEQNIMLRSVKMSGYEDFILDEDVSDEWSQSFYSEKHSIIISVIERVVEDIIIFCKYAEDGTPVWPE